MNRTESNSAKVRLSGRGYSPETPSGATPSPSVADAAGPTQTENTHRQTHRQFVLFTVIAGVVAALAAWGSAALMLEVWVMFAGFIAWFTRPTSSREGFFAMICLWLGTGLGAASYVATGALTPSLGSLAPAVGGVFRRNSDRGSAHDQRRQQHVGLVSRFGHVLRR